MDYPSYTFVSPESGKILPTTFLTGASSIRMRTERSVSENKGSLDPSCIGLFQPVGISSTLECTPAVVPLRLSASRTRTVNGTSTRLVIGQQKQIAVMPTAQRRVFTQNSESC